MQCQKLYLDCRLRWHPAGWQRWCRTCAPTASRPVCWQWLSGVHQSVPAASGLHPGLWRSEVSKLVFYTQSTSAVISGRMEVGNKDSAIETNKTTYLTLWKRPSFKQEMQTAKLQYLKLFEDEILSPPKSWQLNLVLTTHDAYTSTNKTQSRQNYYFLLRADAHHV